LNWPKAEWPLLELWRNSGRSHYAMEDDYVFYKPNPIDDPGRFKERLRKLVS
jgi:hypothetical protein